jgi:hypothetical protein
MLRLGSVYMCNTLEHVKAKVDILVLNRHKYKILCLKYYYIDDTSLHMCFCSRIRKLLLPNQ